MLRRADGYGRPAAGAVILLFLLFMTSCRVSREGEADRSGGVLIPGSPFRSAVSLGNLRAGTAPSETETRLSEFLFGEPPARPLGMVKPAGCAARDGVIWTCDPALSAVFRRNRPGDAIEIVALDPEPVRPVSIMADAMGGVLIADAGEQQVIRYDAAGRCRTRYTLAGHPFRPADAIDVGTSVWATNVLGHCIEVFDGANGTHLRSIGRRGAGRGEFGVPLGMALTANGNVLVVDMLNGRVQEFDESGHWRRNIGRAGDRTGCFGRPKDVAVGPDGCIFVTDAALQCVHVFDASGATVATFGGEADSASRLSVPNGIAVTMNPPEEMPEPMDKRPHYFVLVAEELRDPGIRVFGWLGRSAGLESSGASTSQQPGSGRMARVKNPHWRADRCSACHEMSGGRPSPIASERVDSGCVSCHDGKQAIAEAHPVGRWMSVPGISTPEGWPTNQGRIGCLTCHDIQRHCSTSVARPTNNAAMLRGSEMGGSVSFCLQCHSGSETWRVSPHAQVAADGTIREETCLFCHQTAPQPGADPKRTGQPGLRTGGSRMCLGCHSRHWDYFPEGHFDQRVPERMKGQLVLEGASGEITGMEDGPGEASGSVLPLDEGRVACYTCHNPHAAGVFGAASQLGGRASEPRDERFMLRRDRPQLCLTCHMN